MLRTGAASEEAASSEDTSAHLPKFVLHRGTHSHELRKVMGTSKYNDSSAAFSI